MSLGLTMDILLLNQALLNIIIVLLLGLTMRQSF